MLVEICAVKERTMGIVGWLIFGGLVGWITSKVMGTDAEQGILLNIVSLYSI